MRVRLRGSCVANMQRDEQKGKLVEEGKQNIEGGGQMSKNAEGRGQIKKGSVHLIEGRG